MFEDTSKPHRLITDAILSKLYEWVLVGQNQERSPFRSLIFDWDSFIMLPIVDVPLSFLWCFRLCFGFVFLFERWLC